MARRQAPDCRSNTTCCVHRPATGNPQAVHRRPTGPGRGGTRQSPGTRLGHGSHITWPFDDEGRSRVPARLASRCDNPTHFPGMPDEASPEPRHPAALRTRAAGQCPTAGSTGRDARTVARADAETRVARRRQHRDARHRAGAEPADERPVLPPLLRRARTPPASASSRAPARASSSTRRTATSSPTPTSSRTPRKSPCSCSTTARSRPRSSARTRARTSPCVKVQAAEPDADPDRRFGPHRGRRLRRRDRQPVRARPHRDLRHRERARPLGHQPGGLRGLHPDGCLDQPGQLRRRAREPQWRAGRHQLRHPLAHRRQHRHRLRDPVEHDEDRDEPADEVRQGQARRARRQHPDAHARTSRRAWGSATPRRARWSRRWSRARPPRRPASRPATSSRRSTAGR